MKKKLSEFGIGFYLTVVAIIFTVLAAVFYSKSGVTDFAKDLDNQVVIISIISAVIALISMVLEVIPNNIVKLTVKPVRYVSFLMTLYAYIAYLGTQATYIANLLVAIDPTPVTSGFVMTNAFFVLAAVLTLVSACLNAVKPWDKSDKCTVEVVTETK